MASQERSPNETGELEATLDDLQLPIPVTQVVEPGELIVLLLKPSPWYIVLEALPMLVGTGLTTAILLLLDASTDLMPGSYRRDIVIAAVGLGGLRLFWQLLDWLYTVYLLTDRRLVQLRGVVRMQQLERPLEQVQGADLIATARERALGLSSIIFSLTPDDHHYAHAWRSISRPAEVHRIIMDTLHRYRRKQ